LRSYVIPAGSKMTGSSITSHEIGHNNSACTEEGDILSPFMFVVFLSGFSLDL
jgi:hypothetical protein